MPVLAFLVFLSKEVLTSLPQERMFALPKTYTTSYNRQQPYVPPVGVDPQTAQWYNQASAAFRTHDQDMNGTLSFPEFEMAMRSLGFPFQNPQHAMQVFQTADLDKSGTIGEREFCEFFVYTRRTPAPAPVMNVGVPAVGMGVGVPAVGMGVGVPAVGMGVGLPAVGMGVGLPAVQGGVGMPAFHAGVNVGSGHVGGGLHGVVSLRSHHGHYVCGEPNHVVIANRPARAQWEAWTIVPTPDGRVAFRSYHGKLLCAEQNHSVVANRDAVGPWESWTPVPLGPNAFAFRSHHGKFLCAEPNGVVVANRDAQGPWEVFTVDPHHA